MGNSRGHIMTLANSIIGVGILAMPFCFQKCGIVLAILLLIMSNFITRLCCYYLLKSSFICRRRSMEIIAFSVFGSSGKLMVELCIIGYLLGACITYFVVVGDLGPQITAKMFDLNQTNTLRTVVLVIVTIVCILPLGLLRNVDSLAAVCTASIGFYFCLVLKIMSESSERIAAGDWMYNVDYWKVSGILQCLPIFSMALSCQMQLFEVFENVSNLSIDKMNEYVKSATTICTFVYILVGFFGYVAFCTKPFSGNILLNLSPSLASDAIKIGFVLSVAFSFPLMIFPCRVSLYSLLYRRGHSDVAHYIPEHRFKLITMFLVGLALLVGILIPSIELVIGFVGSTIGVAICIMFPASCYIKICQKNSTEKLLAQVLLIFGFVLMVLGTYANLSAIDEQNSGPSLDKDQSMFKHNDDSNENLSLNLSEKHVPPLEIEVNRLIVADVVPEKLKSDLKDDKFEQLPQIVSKERDKYDVNSDDELNLIQTLKSSTDIPKISEAVIESKHLEGDGNDKSLSETKTDETKKNNDINNDAIQKEDLEIAIEKKQQKANEGGDLKRLEETKKLLEEMKEIKSVLEKKNEETQQLVLQKFDEIVDKVEKIENMQEEENKKHQKETVDIISQENDIGVESKKKIEDQQPKETAYVDGKESVQVSKALTINSPIINMLINNQNVADTIDEKQISSKNNKSEQPPNDKLPSNGEIEHIQRDLLNIAPTESQTEHIQRDLQNIVPTESPNNRPVISNNEVTTGSVRTKRDTKKYAEDCSKHLTDEDVQAYSENDNILPKLVTNIANSVKIMGIGRGLKSVQHK